jgi:hypothetical protein
MCEGHSNGSAEPIEILPAPDLYVIEFAFPRHLGISVIIPATCGLAAKLRAWTMFPEHKRTASRTSVCPVEYVEIDWQTGRSIVMKQKPRPAIPPGEELSTRNKKKSDRERAE